MSPCWGSSWRVRKSLAGWLWFVLAVWHVGRNDLWFGLLTLLIWGKNCTTHNRLVSVWTHFQLCVSPQWILNKVVMMCLKWFWIWEIWWLKSGAQTSRGPEFFFPGDAAFLNSHIISKNQMSCRLQTIELLFSHLSSGWSSRTLQTFHLFNKLQSDLPVFWYLPIVYILW